MSGPLACLIVIFCLSLTSGAPNQKNVYTFDSSGIPVTSTKLFPAANSIISRKDDLIHAVCEGVPNIEYECKIYVKGDVMCDIKLNYTDLVYSYTDDVKLFNSGYSKAVFAIREDATKIKLTSINLKGCQVRAVLVDVPKSDTYDRLQSQIFILPNEEDYDVFYVNTQLCGDFMCKATYDYDGNIVTAASAFPLNKSFIGRYQFDNVNGTIVAHSIDHYLWHSNGVYLVHDKDKEPQTLVNDTNNYLVGFTADENKVNYCLRIDKNKTITCTQYDIEGKTKIVEFNVTIGNKTIRSVYPYNLEKGMHVVIQEDINNCAITIPMSETDFDEWDEKTQDKSVTIDAKCSPVWAEGMTFYKNSHGRYCYLRVCPELGMGTVEVGMCVQNVCMDKTKLF